MGGCEMGRQQKRCVAVSGRRLEELRQRVQPAGRGADTDDEELAPMADLPGVLTRPLVQPRGGSLVAAVFRGRRFLRRFRLLGRGSAVPWFLSSHGCTACAQVESLIIQHATYHLFGARSSLDCATLPQTGVIGRKHWRSRMVDSTREKSSSSRFSKTREVWRMPTVSRHGPMVILEGIGVGGSARRILIWKWK